MRLALRAHVFQLMGPSYRGAAPKIKPSAAIKKQPPNVKKADLEHANEPASVGDDTRGAMIVLTSCSEKNALRHFFFRVGRVIEDTVAIAFSVGKNFNPPLGQGKTDGGGQRVPHFFHPGMQG